MMVLFGIYIGIIGTLGVQSMPNKKPCVVDAQTNLCMVLKEEKK
jgi:hypothetical protein